MNLPERPTHPRRYWSPYSRGPTQQQNKSPKFSPHATSTYRARSPPRREAWIEPHPHQAPPAPKPTPAPEPDYSATAGMHPRAYATFFGGPMGGSGPLPPEPSRTPSPPSTDDVQYTTDKHTGIRIPRFRRAQPPPERVTGHPGMAYLIPVTLVRAKVKNHVTQEESIRTIQCPTGVVLSDEKGVDITYLQTPGSIYAAEYDAMLEGVQAAERSSLAEYAAALAESTASGGRIPPPPPHDPELFKNKLLDPDQVILERVLRCKFTGQHGHSDEVGCHYCYNGNLPVWYEIMWANDPEMM